MTTPAFYYDSVTYDFVSLKGEVNPGTGQQLQELTRSGVDGVAFRRVGRRGYPFRMYSVRDVVNEVAAQDLIHYYKEMQGQIINITDELGNDWYNVIVLNVRMQQPKYATAISGGLAGVSSGLIVRADWTLQMTETSWVF
jgi:hypothetical protein